MVWPTLGVTFWHLLSSTQCQSSAQRRGKKHNESESASGPLIGTNLKRHEHMFVCGASSRRPTVTRNPPNRHPRRWLMWRVENFHVVRFDFRARLTSKFRKHFAKIGRRSEATKAENRTRRVIAPPSCHKKPRERPQSIFRLRRGV